MVTVFTPTYNRAHLLPKLYRSLQIQTCKDFEWLIIDDGSTDNTESIVNEWLVSESSFPIRYYKVPNGGKMRAINMGASLAKGEVFCGIDSDDWFYNDAIKTIIDAFESIKSETDFAGVSFSKSYNDGTRLDPIGKISDYIDCKNYERDIYGMCGDMIQVYYIGIMKRYSIPIWKDEKFTPESVFIDQMAIDGYKMRYYTKVLYAGDYLEGGLTVNSWRLLKDNPMGYAMMYNVQMQFHKGIRRKLLDIIQFVSCCCIKREYMYVLKCYYHVMALFLFVPGLLLAQRRRMQFKKYC